MENDELRRIKKLYGEKMVHLCKKLFPTILNTPNLLLNILKSTFAPTLSLIDDIIDNDLEEEFKIFILSFIEEKNNYVECDETPFQLLEKAGYKLYECKSEDDIQSFKKYYEEDEVICTITKKNRLKRCHVFFAVKKNVDEIKREDFHHPERDDVYGTSVISIQFDRGRLNTVSIKNRYNHTVFNPDSTFDNDLEKIIPGLTKSFEKHYGLNIIKQIDDIKFIEYLTYVRANDNKYYRYNCEFDLVYYCENNIIIDHGIIINKYYKSRERFILMDYFVLDKKEKRLYLYDEYIADSFVDSVTDLGKIKDIIVKREDDIRTINIIFENGQDCEIKIDSKNRIISYINNYVDKIQNNFMYYYTDIEHIELNNVSKIYYNFLPYSHNIKEVRLPKVKEIGDYFMISAFSVKKLFIPEALIIGDHCLSSNVVLEELFAPKIEQFGNFAFEGNRSIVELSLSRLRKTGICFLCYNKVLKNFYAPNLQIVGEGTLKFNNNINISGYLEKDDTKKSRKI